MSNMPGNVPFNITTRKGSRNIFVNSSVQKNVYKNGVLVSSTKKDEDGKPCVIPGMPQMPMMRPEHKEVKNQFNIEDGTIKHLAIGNKGPVTFKDEKKVYSDGARNNATHISDGNFNECIIGGGRRYRNEDSQMDVCSRDSEEEGDVFNLEESVKTILKRGVTTQQFLKALKEGYKISILCREIENKSKEDVQEYMGQLLS